MMNIAIPEVLLVEDNPADVELAEYAMRQGKIKANMHVANDAVTALAFLRREGQYAEAPRPDLILLDLSLPGMNGREFLTEVKSDRILQTIPVGILTSSAAEEDILRSYKLGASCYMLKPPDREQFIRLIDCMKDFWLTFVRFPKKIKH